MNIKLQKLRKEKNITQFQMAFLMKCNEKTYRDKELGKRAFNMDEMFLISSILEKNISDIFLGLR